MTTEADAAEAGFVSMEKKAAFDGRKGTQQPDNYKDWSFAFLFLAHMVLIIYLFITAEIPNDGGIDSYSALATFSIYCALAAVFFSSIYLVHMLVRPHKFIKSSLLLAISSLIGSAAFGVLVADGPMALFGLLGSIIGSLYLFFIWRRIPYIAINFETGIIAVKKNLGLLFLVVLFQLISVAFAIVWCIACTGAIHQVGLGILVVFCISYLWVGQVLKNIVHVAVARIVGRWWYSPENSPPLAPEELLDAFSRSMTVSFGSICLGGLLVNCFHGLRKLFMVTQDNERCSFLHAVVACLIRCIREFVIYMNKWGYVYVGLYGYSFSDAGKNVTILFRNKGWKVLITDDLGDNILFILNLAVAATTGIIGILLSADQTHGYMLKTIGFSRPYTAGFIIGLSVGFIISSTLLGMVGGAMNAVIVCFAESSQEFEQNHPRQSSLLRDEWALELPDNSKSGYRLSKGLSTRMSLSF